MLEYCLSSVGDIIPCLCLLLYGSIMDKNK